MIRWLSRRPQRALASFAAAVAAMVTSPVASSAQLYRIEKVDRPPAHHDAERAEAVDPSGRFVSGFGKTVKGNYLRQPFLMRDGVSNVIESPTEAVVVETTSVNSRGEVTGAMGFRAHVWGQDGKATDLDPLLQCSNQMRQSRALRINEVGTLLLTLDCSRNETNQRSFFLKNNSLSLLPNLGGGHNLAYDMNEAGWVVGESSVQERGDNRLKYQHAYVLKDGVMTDLGTNEPERNSRAVAINEKGHVVIMVLEHLAPARLYLHDGKTSQPLNNCADEYLAPVAISGDDTVVAVSGGFNSPGYVLQGDQCNRLQDLLDESGAGWEYLSITDINEAGVITGTGIYKHRDRGFVAKPVPPLAAR